jgi:hypothetical protein
VARSSLARSVRAARVMEPGGGSASVWGACVRWASTSVQPEGCVASDLGAALNRPAGAHERFLRWRPAAAVHQAYRQPHKQCLVRGASGLAGDLASVVIARGVSVADSCLSTILLTCHYSADVPCDVSPVADGPKCRYEVAEYLSAARASAVLASAERGSGGLYQGAL